MQKHVVVLGCLVVAAGVAVAGVAKKKAHTERKAETAETTAKAKASDESSSTDPNLVAVAPIEPKLSPPKTLPKQPTLDEMGPNLDGPARPDQAHVLNEEQIQQPPDEDELAELKKRGIPAPPTQERAGYVAWKAKLPKATRTKLARYCRSYSGEYRAACNGIGPLAIPIPPSLVRKKNRDTDGNAIGMTHDQWEANLTPAQNRYYKNFCRIDEGDPGEGNGFSQLCGGTPLVLSFGSERVQYTIADERAMQLGASTDWPTAATPWLAMDRDGDGAITSAAELFGSDTLLEGGRAKHGFAALAALDANRDGAIDAQDPAFAQLLVWSDRDGDRQSSPSELAPLADSVVSLSLGYQREPHCDERMNCEGERAAMQWRDASGAVRSGSVIDVYLHYQ